MVKKIPEVADILNDFKSHIENVARLHKIRLITDESIEVRIGIFAAEMLFRTQGLAAVEKYDIYLLEDVSYLQNEFKGRIRQILIREGLSNAEIDAECATNAQILQEHWLSFREILNKEIFILLKFRRLYREDNEREMWLEEKRFIDPLEKYLDLEEDLLKKGYPKEEIEKLRKKIDEEIKQDLLADGCSSEDIKELRENRKKASDAARKRRVDNKQEKKQTN